MYSGTMLNSGSVKNYVPIGEDGRPVWSSADAFRQAIALAPALGRKYSDVLAVPRFSSGGEMVNWFVPFEPEDPAGHQVVMWEAASPEEKRAAMSILNDFERRLNSFGHDLQQHALTADDKVFAHFLTGTSVTENLPAIHFPDINCVYIVDGRPVITFWGFLKRGADLSSSPFEDLRPKVTPRANSAAAENTTATVAAVPWWKRHLLCLCLLPLLLALLGLLSYLLWWWLFARPLDLPLFETVPDLKNWSLEPVREEKDPAHQKITVSGVDTTVTPVDGVAAKDGENLTDATVADPAVTDANSPADNTDDTDKGADDALLPGENIPDEKTADNDAGDDAQKNDGDALDEASAQNDANAQKADEHKTAPDNSQDAVNKTDPVDPDNAGAAQNTDENGNIKLDRSALNAGNVQGLDGAWNTSSGLVDSRTGKPVSIKYRFKGGDGQAEITRSDGVKCQTASKGTAASGALSISGGLASCSDGSSVQLPKVKCTPDADGKTSCVGVYDNGKGQTENVNMDLYR